MLVTLCSSTKGTWKMKNGLHWKPKRNYIQELKTLPGNTQGGSQMCRGRQASEQPIKQVKQASRSMKLEELGRHEPHRKTTSKFYPKNLKHCQETPIGTCKWRSTDLKPEWRQWKITKVCVKSQAWRSQKTKNLETNGKLKGMYQKPKMEKSAGRKSEKKLWQIKRYVL
jgi:hypothetical protein